MRLTIIKNDGFVSVNGEGYNGINLSSLPNDVHAVQWYEDQGEVEINDTNKRIVENKSISSLDDYLFVIPLWEAAKESHLDNENRIQTELPS